jgi:diaminopimelate epimerase
MTYQFIKMNGLGNDFVIFDGRTSKLNLTPQELTAIADRHTGVGCDQIIVLEPALAPHADLFMRIYNANGQEAEACGNAARCVTWLMAKELKSPSIIIETLAGIIYGKWVGDHEVEVAMGQASFDWKKIPLSQTCDPLCLDITLGSLKEPTAVNVGNPHVVFFAIDPTDLELAALGTQLEHHSLFPEGVNINVAYIVDSTTLLLKVWERGVGLTQACGTGACATAAVAIKRNLVEHSCQVIQSGGSLQIEIDADNYITMRGQVAENFRGCLTSSFFENIKS